MFRANRTTDRRNDRCVATEGSRFFFVSPTFFVGNYTSSCRGRRTIRAHKDEQKGTGQRKKVEELREEEEDEHRREETQGERRGCSGHDVLFDSIKSVGFEAVASSVGYTLASRSALDPLGTKSISDGIELTFPGSNCYPPTPLSSSSSFSIIAIAFPPTVLMICSKIPLDSSLELLTHFSNAALVPQLIRTYHVLENVSRRTYWCRVRVKGKPKKDSEDNLADGSLRDDSLQRGKVSFGNSTRHPLSSNRSDRPTKTEISISDLRNRYLLPYTCLRLLFLVSSETESETSSSCVSRNRSATYSRQIPDTEKHIWSETKQ